MKAPKQVRYFSAGTNAVQFVNDVIAKGGHASLTPPANWLSPTRVTYIIPVKAHLRKGRPVRGSARRVRRSR